MFGKLDVRRKSIVTSALSYDNREIVVRYFVNRASGILQLTQCQSTEEMSELWLANLWKLPTGLVFKDCIYICKMYVYLLSVICH